MEFANFDLWNFAKFYTENFQYEDITKVCSSAID